MEIRTCKGPCEKLLPATEEHFYLRKSSRNGKLYASPYCRICERGKASSARKAAYATSDGRDRILKQNLTYRDTPERRQAARDKQNKKYALDDEFRATMKERAIAWYRDNPANKARKKTRFKAWYVANYARLRQEWNERFRSDPAFRLRNNLRHAIWEALRFAGGSKSGRSILAHLPYSMEALKAHLELLWEPWMAWENYGVLDPTVRTWQIGHVTPQASLPFADFSDANFLRCWALSNLRPLESSKNLEKGCRPEIATP